MNHYTHITLLPDPECPLAFLRNSLCAKLHKALFELEAKDIGISFPEYDGKFLGKSIRLHSKRESLEKLQAKDWLGGLKGYCRLDGIQEVPSEVRGYQNICRIQSTMSETRMKRKIAHAQKNQHLADDKSLGEFVQSYRKEMYKRSFAEPYLELKSTSSHQRYRIYLKFGAIEKQPADGDFNQFGLSKTARVPIF